MRATMDAGEVARTVPNSYTTMRLAGIFHSGIGHHTCYA
jgi:hypothetical protein